MLSLAPVTLTALVASAGVTNGTARTAASVRTSPPLATAVGGALNGVACVTDSDCTSVGYAINRSENSRTLVETWNGSMWAVEKTPNPVGAIDSQLAAVACADDSDCTAVGNYLYKRYSARALVLHWNGSRWKLVPIPNPTGAKYSALNSVACPRASWCMAVGTYYLTSPVTGTPLTFAEDWNGATWEVLRTPDPAGSDGSSLNSVACENASLCEAVGNCSPNTAGGLDTLAEAWNGTTWQLVTTPYPAGATRSFLAGVSCTSVSDCMAVGQYASSATDVLTLAESWNGRSGGSCRRLTPPVRSSPP